jgi:hypothetical protein
MKNQIRISLVRALVASLGAAALIIPSHHAFARSGAAAAHGPVAAPRPVSTARHYHRRRNGGSYWPGDYGYDYGATDGGPYAAVAQPTYEAPRATCTYDMPWDWAHRCPPAVAPTEKAYAPSCPTEVMKFPGRDGAEQTVNITRCY